MEIIIAAIGKLRPGPERDLCETYLKRAAAAGRGCGISAVSVREFAESRAATVAQRKREEGERLVGIAGAGRMVVAMDESGDNPTSRQFAHMLARMRARDSRGVVFAIGGPDGLDDSVLAAASRRIALGRMTWPHRLARAMLAEQIYRAVTIINNHPYHRQG